jgi:hypothetical protein
MRKALLGTWSKKFVTITEDSDEVIMYEWMAEKNYKDKMIDLNNKLINLPKSNYKSNDAQELDKIKSNLEAMHKIAELALNKHIELFFYDKSDDSKLKENQCHCLHDLKNYIKLYMEDLARYSSLLKRDRWCDLYDIELSLKIEEYLEGKYNREQKLRSVILR